MANSNTQGFGLIAAGTLGSTPATSGQGKYFIDANTVLREYIVVGRFLPQQGTSLKVNRPQTILLWEY